MSEPFRGVRTPNAEYYMQGGHAQFPKMRAQMPKFGRPIFSEA